MKKIFAAVLLVLVCSTLAFAQPSGPMSYQVPGAPTAGAGWSFPGSVAMPDSYSGASKYAINGSGTITLTGLNRTYTIALATSPILKIQTLDAQTYWLAIKNQTAVGSPGGVTVWSTDPIRGGFGVGAWSGNTIWVNGTGNTRYEVPMEAMTDPSGVKYWSVRDTSASINYK